MNQRNFTITEAKREAVPLLIGLVAPSGGGKTGSALELAHGIQDVVGGDIGGIDTEANRMKHYAGAEMFSDKGRRFKFKHLAFGAPFNPDSYRQAIDTMLKAGCKTIIVDSMSHEHEGPGGVLEMHEEELNKRAGSDWDKRNKATFACWAKPKAERRALINFLLQQNANFILCFRAKEKLKLQPGKPPVELGWQPIAGDEFVYEMTLNALFLPGAEGTPIWMPQVAEERKMVKRPEQFKSICSEGRKMSAAMGRELALWAKGDTPALPAPKPETPKPSLAMEQQRPSGPEPEFALDGAKPETDAMKALLLNNAINACKTKGELEKYRQVVLDLPDSIKPMVGPTFNAKNHELKGGSNG